MLRIALHNRVQHYRDLSKATKSQLLNLKVVAPFPGDSPQRSNKCKMQLIGKSCSELHCITECSIVGFKQSRQVSSSKFNNGHSPCPIPRGFTFYQVQIQTTTQLEIQIKVKCKREYTDVRASKFMLNTESVLLGTLLAGIHL